MELIWGFLISTGIIGGLVSLLFRSLEQKLERDRKERERHEQMRREFETFQISMQTATAALCEANAIALQRGTCNGETHAALEYLKEVKHKQKDFLFKQGICHIME